MDRETKQLEIGRHTFVLKTYATAREAIAIQQIALKGSKFDLGNTAAGVGQIDPAAMFAVQEEMVRQMVVSMDTTTESIVERCLDLPNDEYLELVKALDEIATKKN